MTWYKYTVNRVLEMLGSSLSGLSEHERALRLKKHGMNTLAEKEEQKLWRKIGKHFVDLLMIILIVAAILKGLTGSYVEMFIILAVVLINGLIGYFQERKAEESLNGLKQMMGQESIVLSDGVRQTMDSEVLVPGDIVVLQSGDIVPADLRLFEVHDLLIEESVLTGESLPVEKNPARFNEETPLGDRLNMAFSGTLVKSGTGKGIVVETGDATEIGQINQALQTVEKQTTPLILKINQLNKQIFKGLMGLIVFLIFFTTFRYGMDLGMLLSTVIALIVAVIPEGLPAVLTMILSMGVNEMAEKQAIVKSMPAVETLGAMTVICSDKTGTLTKNEMSVTEVITLHGAKKFSDMDKVSEDGILSIMNNCQELKLSPEQKIEELSGNPTELALLKFAAQYDVPYLPIVDKIPFSSEYKYMATIHQLATGERVLFVKGAPEVLLSRSSVSSEQAEFWNKEGAALAKKGQRVLGLAMKSFSQEATLSHEAIADLELVALAGIMDPPKESAVQAVKESRQAGISVKMITGDHKDTAQAIGKQIGLAHVSNVIEGKDLDQMDEQELQQRVKEVDVFARTTPEHKLRIVSALQKNGEIVGMTGDGVNDAPALKKADIGIAMGIKGSEVSKQAADMVLADDNFATIAAAVKEGRRIYDNLKKTIKFFLPTALAQGLIVIFALLTNRPLPLTPVQILWVNMATTITLSYALGFEAANKTIMKRQPRDPQAPILSGYSLFRIGYVSLLITIPSYLLSIQAETALVQQTILLQSIVLAQAFYMINCRELTDPAINKGLFRNKALLVSLGGLVILQGTVLMLPAAQEIIGTTHLTLEQHVSAVLIGLGIFVIVEVEKMITKRWAARQKTLIAQKECNN
ncbi:HAD-IC family P-type ATPase [Vagococcus elongatus]|uniref:ATPase n=1 Tax=Vagococcus elongatus TaxID=180344 RepID=A0A430B210_9ENTE|nr:HAD-IC family P-type ATPase [Vagococcus elongatus]RSU14291.1 ATPase [Vagococcus elongatus]